MAGFALLAISGAQPAQADDPAFYSKAPAAQDWHSVTMDKAVINTDGVVYLPLRDWFNSVQTEVVCDPDGQKDKIKLVCGNSAYVLHTYVEGNVRYVGLTANGPWYQTKNVNGSLYSPMAFFQTMVNRQMTVTGDKTLGFGDASPKWVNTQNGYQNTNPFWKGALEVYNNGNQAVQAAAPLTANPQVARAYVADHAQGNAVNGEALVAAAQKEMGVPYVWGGMSPAGFDCSGLTSYVYAQQGIRLPRTAEEQRMAASPVSMNDLKPGDLVFWGEPAYHVGIYIGNGQYIHAPQPGQSVSVSSVNWYPFTSAGRVA